VGAPVKFKGVQIGSVASIRIRLSPSEGRLRQDVTDLRLPVIVEIERSQLVAQEGTGQALTEPGFEEMVKRGLRAQLNVESLLTGLLYIDLDLHPDAPLSLALEPGSGPYREIPTVPTRLEAIQEQATRAVAKFEQIDFQALVTSITTAANSIKEVASSPSLKATLDSLKETTANLNKTVISVRAAIDHANTKIDPLLASLQKNSDEVNSTMKQTSAALAQLQSTLDPDSPLLVRLSEALEQLAGTTRSIGELTDYLQRNPAALIRGRYVPDKER